MITKNEKTACNKSSIDTVSGRSHKKSDVSSSSNGRGCTSQIDRTSSKR